MPWINKVPGTWSKKFPTNNQRCVLWSLASSPQSYFFISARWLAHLFPAGPLPLMASFLEPSFHTVSNAAESLERRASVFPRQAPPCQLHGHPGRRGEHHLLVGFLPSHLPCPLHPSCGNPPWRVAQSPWSSNTSVCEFCTNETEIVLPACQIMIVIRNFLWKHRLYKLPLDLQTWTKKTAPSQKIWSRDGINIDYEG